MPQAKTPRSFTAKPRRRPAISASSTDQATAMTHVPSSATSTSISSSDGRSSASVAQQQADKKGLSFATVSQYESYINNFRAWCDHKETPAEYAGCIDKISYHTPRAMLAWTQQRMHNASAKQAGTAISARSAFLWWVKPRLGDAAVETWKEEQLPSGEWKVEGNPVKHAPYEEYIEQLKSGMPKRIYRPRKRDLISNGGKVRSSSPGPLKFDAIMSKPHGHNDSSSAHTSPSTSFRPSGMLSSSSAGTETSPVWPHHPLSNGTPMDECFCDQSSQQSIRSNGDVTQAHSHRCRYGAILRRDVDTMVSWLDHQLGDRLLSDVARVRLEWLRCILLLGFYLWAVPRELTELRLTDVRIMQDKSLDDGEQQSLTISMQWRGVPSAGAPPSPAMSQPHARSYAIVNVSSANSTELNSGSLTSTASPSSRTLDALNRWLTVHASIWPDEPSGYLFPRIDKTGLRTCLEPLCIRTLHEMLQEVSDETHLTGKGRTFSGDALRNGAMIDTIVNCRRRDMYDLRRWVSWAGVALGEVPGSFSNRIEDEFNRMQSPSALGGSNPAFTPMGQQQDAQLQPTPAARMATLQSQLSSHIPPGTNHIQDKLFGALERLSRGSGAQTSSQSWYELAQAAGEMGNFVTGSPSNMLAPSQSSFVARDYDSTSLQHHQQRSNTGQRRYALSLAMQNAANGNKDRSDTEMWSAQSKYDVHDHGMHLHS